MAPKKQGSSYKEFGLASLGFFNAKIPYELCAGSTGALFVDWFRVDAFSDEFGVGPELGVGVHASF